MATREKTITYCFDTYTSTSTDATVTNMTQTTLYIPETVIAFTSVWAGIGWNDVATAHASHTENRLGFQLGAAGYSTVTDTGGYNSSGENLGALYSPFDYTSYFTTNWTGTSMTCDCQFFFDQSSGTTLGMTNVTVELNITYTYDDDTTTNATQIKTIFLPIESATGALPTTQTELGTNQIPALTGGSGILPESTITIRDYAFIIGDCDNNANTGTTDWTVSASIDSGTAYSFAPIEMGLQSNRYWRGIWRPTVPTTTTAHTFELYIDTGTRGHAMPVMLMITYEFDASTASDIFNSIQIPVIMEHFTGQASADKCAFSEDFYIAEPTTVTLRQSGLRINWETNGTFTGSGILLQCGGQTARTYTNNGTQMGCFQSLMHRIDSGGAQGAGITLARGKNTFSGSFYNTNVGDRMGGTTAILYLNYTSGRSTDGIGAHNHTVRHWMTNYGQARSGDINVKSDWSLAIPETDYYLQSAAFVFDYRLGGTTGTGSSMDIQAKTGEGKEDGYYKLDSQIWITDNETMFKRGICEGKDRFLRFPEDVGPNRMDIETARDYRVFVGIGSMGAGLRMFATYHSNTFTVSGDITNSDGGTVTLKLYDATSKEQLDETTVTGDATYTFTVYDPSTDAYEVKAYDATGNAGGTALLTAT